MATNKKINSINIKDGLVKTIDFKFKRLGSELEAKEFFVTFEDSKIELFKRDYHKYNDREIISTYNDETNVKEWYLDHVCGLSGFGLGLNDVCPACEAPGQKLLVIPENMHQIRVHGSYYSQELDEFVFDEINLYRKKLEQIIPVFGEI